MSLKKITIALVAFVGTWGTAQNSRLADLVTEFEMDTWALERTYIVDESEEYYQRFTLFYADWQKRMFNIDFSSLSQQGKVDYVLLKNLVTKGNYFLNQDYSAYKGVKEVGDFVNPIFPFIQER